MKKIFTLIFVSIVTLLSACVENQNTLKIGVNFYPMPQIIDLIYDDLLEAGIELEMVQMDYQLLNQPLAQKEIDGNMIQHEHFMNFFNQSNDATLVIAQPVYHSIFAIYSQYYLDKGVTAETLKDEVEDAETVYIPEDSVNLPRALLLLQSAGLITLADGKVFNATLDDIVENPKNLVFEPKSLGTTPHFYHDSGRRLAVMYPSYARAAIQLEDDTEFIFTETLNDITETYAISFVTRADNLNDPRIQTFITYLTSQKVKDWLLLNYGWAAIPAF